MNYEKPCVTDTSVKKDCKDCGMTGQGSEGGGGRSQSYRDATHLMQNERDLFKYIHIYILDRNLNAHV